MIATLRSFIVQFFRKNGCARHNEKAAMLQCSMARRAASSVCMAIEPTKEQSDAPWCIFGQAGPQGRAYREKLREARRVQEGSRGTRVAHGQQAGQRRQ